MTMTKFDKLFSTITKLKKVKHIVKLSEPSGGGG